MDEELPEVVIFIFVSVSDALPEVVTADWFCCDAVMVVPVFAAVPDVSE
jgi:hypothetical protein